MTFNYYQLPTVLILAALVGIFVALGKQNRTSRFRLWRAGWALIFLRFSLQLVYRTLGWDHRVFPAVDLSLMNLSAVVFLTSVSGVPHIPRLRRLFLLSVSAPLVLYSGLYVFGVERTALYLLLLLAFMAAGVGWFWHWFRRVTLLLVLYAAVVVGVTTIAIGQVVQNDLDSGLFACLSLVFAATGVFFWQRFRRLSPGIVITCIGFFSWSAFSPAAYYSDAFLAAPTLINELWHVPKFLVALGMIVTLLEEESIVARRMREREHQLNLQMQRFSDITSRLLGGVDVKGLCSYIADVVAEVTTFRRAIILLADDQEKLQIAGASGMAPAVADSIQNTTARLGLDALGSFCSRQRQVGTMSYRCRMDELTAADQSARAKNFEPTSYWAEGDTLLVPLRSPKGKLVGCVTLDEPRDPASVRAEDLSPIEMLAADLAVAVENAALQRQLLRSEKLAGIGHLVAGVAHELNNPLTAILGYTELLADAENAPKRELDVVRREALRMKKIIENLLRFARQSKYDRQPVQLRPVVEEVVKLRSNDVQQHNVDLTVDLPADLPAVLVDELLLKQVFLNVLGNALEAVATQPERKVWFEAAHKGEFVEIRVKDSGTGFADLNRVFDPFYTTKGVGKGTGLGLSICYGIIRDHGGEIWAQNLQPNGACIFMQLPVRAVMPTTEPGSTRTTTAHI